MGVKIIDVAKVAGVSKTTVSRVLNNSPLIKPETAAKVKKAMEELNYVPNSMARSFANQSTNTIALVVDVDNPTAYGNHFFYQVQYGIEKILCSKGYYLMIANLQNRIRKGDIIKNLILEKRIDGLILPASLLNNMLINVMKEKNFPFVILGEPDFKYDVNWVDINNIMAGELATNHLISRGYKDIAFIVDNLEDKFNENRLKGYKNIMLKNSFYKEKNIYNDVFNKKTGYEIVKQFYQENKIPDAVIFTNNLASFGALIALNELKINIPNEFGLITFDNYPIAQFSSPSVTTVDIDVFELGMKAASILLQQIEKKSISIEHTLLSVKVIQRETTKF